jgi:ubiquinone/menaquinone biosynthesis C-methylase UbiE
MEATQRFSTRVENYIRYRPHYPPAIINLLRDQCGLSKDSVVADIGSGTGILSELFLENGNPIYAVEPNLEMRQAGERLLGHDSRFVSVSGTAEQTNLEPHSINFIVAGQAFHWFNLVLTRKEFSRILAPGGWVALIWNDRRTDSSSFLRGYETLLKEFATDYDQVNHKRIDPDALADFFNQAPSKQSFPNQQLFDLQSLKGRLLSSSYAPEPGNPRHEPMLHELERLYNAEQQNGKVAIQYDTCVFYAQPAW